MQLFEHCGKSSSDGWGQDPNGEAMSYYIIECVAIGVAVHHGR